MKSLENKVAIVTGGTRGIGRAIAERLLDDGAAVAICGRKQDDIDRAVGELKPHGRVIGSVADVSKPEDVSKFFKSVDAAFHRLDILINNAGVGVFRTVAELEIDEWRRVIDINLSGVFYCSKEALSRFLSGNRGGYIINISSLAGKHPAAGGGAYNASKFGLNGFSEAMMLDHRNDDVKVSYVMPGSVATEFGSGSGGDWKIAPEDIAEIVAMLLRMPDRTLVSRVEVRPSKPKK
jgi:3-oxoacyl-[acyl-carrier protein] reductase